MRIAGGFLFLMLFAIFLPLASHSEDMEDLKRPKLPANALRLPIHEQETSYSCGPAALLSILKYWQNYTGRETDLYALLNTNPEEGTNPRGLVRGAQSFGLSALPKEGMSIQDLRQNLSQGDTVILDIQAWDESNLGPDKVDWENKWEDGHYVVLIGIDAEYAYFMDPSMDLNRYGYIPLKELLRRWHDYEVENGQRREYRNLGIIIRGNGSPKLPLPTDQIARIE
jgi:predicted double-glycine peptidase